MDNLKELFFGKEIFQHLDLLEDLLRHDKQAFTQITILFNIVGA